MDSQNDQVEIINIKMMIRYNVKQLQVLLTGGGKIKYIYTQTHMVPGCPLVQKKMLSEKRTKEENRR